jgi:FkbM family methyltransferase
MATRIPSTSRTVSPFEPVARLHGHSFLALRTGARVVELGLYEAAFAREVSAAYGAEVIGCEPHPGLAAADRSRGIPRLTVCEVAIAEETGTAPIYLYEPEAEWTSTISAGLLGESATEQTLVRALTFDDFVELEVSARWGDATIDLLKVDIEAAEIPMFRDASPSALARFQQIAVEFHDFRDEHLAPDVERIKERLRELGFHELRFTLNNEDVLFINERFLRSSRLARLALILRYRIVRGITRRLHRRLRGGEPADTLPAPYRAA